MFEKAQITITQQLNPESQQGEHFLGAFCQELIDIMHWKTKRVGSKSGQKTTSGKDEFFVFVSMSEMQQAHLNPEKNHDGKFPKFVFRKRERHSLENTTIAGRAIV